MKRSLFAQFIGAAIFASAVAAPDPAKVEGLVTPYERVRLAAQSDGVVAEVLLEEGNPIQKEQPLVRLDDRRQVLDEEVASAVAEKAQADLASTEKLYAEKMASRDLVEKARIEADTARARLESAKIAREERIVRAPLAGYLLRLYSRRGEAVHRLENIAEIVDLSRASVIAYFPAKMIGQIKVGQRATVRVPMIRAEPFAGTVEKVDPVIDPGSGVFRVKILLPNEDGSIVAGAAAEVTVSGGED